MTKHFDVDPDLFRNSPVTPNGFEIFERFKELAQSMSDRRADIASALHFTQGTHTVDDIVVMVMTGRLLWWSLPNSFIITEIITYPQTKHFHVFLAGGDLTEIKECVPRLAAAAKLNGCSQVTLSGRRGWINALKDLGWKESHTTASLVVE